MRIFVTGKQGQLARCLGESAAAQGAHQLILAGRPGFDLLAPDAAMASVIAAKPDVIINAAAYTAVDKAESEPDVALATNRDGAAAMAKAAARLGVPLIHISTDYVYSGEKHGAYVEEDATGPLNVYGRSKLAGEMAVQQLAPQHVILRTSWVYSAHGQNFLNTMIRLAKERDTISVVADQTGCPTSAHDLAGVILKIADTLPRGSQRNGVYHCAGAGQTSWFEFARAIFSHLQQQGSKVPRVLPISATEYKTAAQRPKNSALDCRKLKDVFGLEMPPWQKSLEAVLTQRSI